MKEISIYDINGDQITTLVQWDTDVDIYISEDIITQAYDVHFFNSQSSAALVVNSEYEDGILKARIPNSLLTAPYPIAGYVYVGLDDGFRSVYGFKISMRKCPRPSSYVYVDSEDYASVSVIYQKCLTLATSAETYESSAKNYASSASTSANSAKSYASSASTSASSAATSATLAQSYAVGGTSSRSGEDTDNAQYYYNQAKTLSESVEENVTYIQDTADTVENAVISETIRQIVVVSALPDNPESDILYVLAD